MVVIDFNEIFDNEEFKNGYGYEDNPILSDGPEEFMEVIMGDDLSEADKILFAKLSYIFEQKGFDGMLNDLVTLSDELTMNYPIYENDNNKLNKFKMAMIIGRMSSIIDAMVLGDGELAEAMADSREIYASNEMANLENLSNISDEIEETEEEKSDVNSVDVPKYNVNRIKHLFED